MSMLRPIIFIAVLIFLSGCVRKPMEKHPLPPLAIAQNSDGDVTIAWESETGYFYTIYCQDSANGDWKALQHVYRVPGTGQTITVDHQVKPGQEPPRYRILPEKMK